MYIYLTIEEKIAKIGKIIIVEFKNNNKLHIQRLTL